MIYLLICDRTNFLTSNSMNADNFIQQTCDKEIFHISIRMRLEIKKYESLFIKFHRIYLDIFAYDCS